MGGNDVVTAVSGRDTMWGGGGADTLNAGFRGDALAGGSGADLFVFAPKTTGSGLSADRIEDFVSGLDRIDVPTLNPVFNGDAALTAPGQVRFDPVTHMLQWFDSNMIVAEISLVNVTAITRADLL